jgi:hypothetical protein
MQGHATLSGMMLTPFSVYIGEVKKTAAQENAGK